MSIESDIIRDMRSVCDAMNWRCLSGDHFVRQAIEWLAQTPEPLSIHGNDTDGWSVRADGCSAGGDTLIEALCGAIHCVLATDD